MKLYGSFFCLFLFLVVGRSADIFFFATVHIAAALKTLKKIVKKRKKRENISKKR